MKVHQESSMKITHTIIIAVLAILAILFGLIWLNASKENKALLMENEELKNLYETSSETIGEIQANLDAMEQDLSGQLFTPSEIPGSSKDKRDQIIVSIANMREQIEADKKKIAQLEAQLAKSGVQLRSVQDTVNRLKASLADKEKIMEELQERMGIMSATLEEERRLSQQEIAERDKALRYKEQELSASERSANKMYYIVGTRKALLENEIINRRGGILGLGRISVVNHQIDALKYEEINLLDQDEIRFEATKKGYSILSNHVATSYKVEKEGKEYVLKVLDPQNFRKQKFLVIELL